MMPEMDLSVVIKARLELEARRVDAVDSMRSAGPAAEAVDRLAGDRLRSIVSDQRARFGRTDPARVSFGDLAELQRSTDRVAREGLALTMGMLTRAAGLDDGRCEQADLFVGQLAARVDRRLARMSVPGDGESVHRATDVIRRRVPDDGLWDLPVMAHEFGHLVAGGSSSWDPGADVVTAPVATALEGLEGAARAQEEELFCDLFAAYAIGPSFVCTQIFHRLDPWAPAVARRDASHPGDPTRVHAVLVLLDKMRGRTSPHHFDTHLYWARAGWQQMQNTASSEAVLTDEQTAEVTARVASWWAVLTNHLSGFAFTRSAAADQVYAAIRSATAEPPRVGFSATDVLDAAWSVRLGCWFEGRNPDGYEQRAESLLAAALQAGD
jgi:hypothetical protein